MRNKNVIIGIIILILLIGGCVFFCGSNNKRATDVSAGEQSGVQTQNYVDPAEFSSLTQEAFVAHTKAHPDAIIIDVRTPDEVSQGTVVEHPLNIDYYAPSFRDELSKLDRNKPYLIYCRTGHRTGNTKKIMQELGFKRVYDLKGGISAWTGKIYK
jgi:rhodanese-related sulfurtransferase